MVKVVSTQGWGPQLVRSFGQDLYGWALEQAESEKPVVVATKQRQKYEKARRLKNKQKGGGK